jgi:hypothetical protein
MREKSLFKRLDSGSRGETAWSIVVAFMSLVSCIHTNWAHVRAFCSLPAAWQVSDSASLSETTCRLPSSA